MEDKYSLYVLYLGIGENYFWHAPIESVERVAENKTAMDAWKARPKTR